MIFLVGDAIPSIKRSVGNNLSTSSLKEFPGGDGVQDGGDRVAQEHLCIILTNTHIKPLMGSRPESRSTSRTTRSIQDVWISAYEQKAFDSAMVGSTEFVPHRQVVSMLVPSTGQ